jgi:hypothetical protein
MAVRTARMLGISLASIRWRTFVVVVGGGIVYLG